MLNEKNEELKYMAEQLRRAKLRELSLDSENQILKSKLMLAHSSPNILDNN